MLAVWVKFTDYDANDLENNGVDCVAFWEEKWDSPWHSECS